MNNQDIKRLGKVVNLMESVVKLTYHMDEKEYKRMREYISARFNTALPYDNPSTEEKIITSK